MAAAACSKGCSIFDLCGFPAQKLDSLAMFHAARRRWEAMPKEKGTGHSDATDGVTALASGKSQRCCP